MLGPALALAAYLLGSISFAALAASQQGVDLRDLGSGNLGATNAGRVLGKRIGWIVMVLDMLKGFAPVAAARWALDLPWPWITTIGLAAVLGHCFPIWHGFRGGKGAATASGVLLAALPIIGVLTLASFFVAKKLSRRAAVGSLSAATVAVALTLGLDGGQWPVRLAVGLWLIVVVRHRDNILRLLRGKEPPG